MPIPATASAANPVDPPAGGRWPPLPSYCQGNPLLLGNAPKQLGEVQPKHRTLATHPHHRDRAGRRSIEAVFRALDALPVFDYQRLDAFKVAREVLRLGDALARRLPRGYATLQDQLRRALLSAYLGIAEASSRQGADRLCRFRCARGEACEAAAALEGVLVLNLAPEPEILTLLVLLDRLCAMLTRLAHMGERPSGAAPAGQRARER